MASCCNHIRLKVICVLLDLDVGFVCHNVSLSPSFVLSSSLYLCSVPSLFPHADAFHCHFRPSFQSLPLPSPLQSPHSPHQSFPAHLPICTSFPYQPLIYIPAQIHCSSASLLKLPLIPFLSSLCYLRLDICSLLIACFF